MGKGRSAVDMTGVSFGRLTGVERRGSNAKGQALWLFDCACGGSIVGLGIYVRSGDLRSCGCLRKERGYQSLPDEMVRYQSMHLRVGRERGAASAHECADCGGSAREWSLSRGAPATVGPGLPYRFSLDVMDYEPRCVLCHRSHDATQRAA